ncbi:hypothetical protein [Niabella beijingensis]|uniref:hypothetical protein n=1 Tax=Niabella beijingensis TaxID=2872700 RepID=UPI001CC1708C|nr:hypothetical protein [Niabella beijingensis]MBZ4192640.1 hypothetical protein [Niabella beijingensis]
MFSLFNNNNGDESALPPGQTRQIHETQERWFTFLKKLEERVEELCTAAIPELKAMRSSTDAVYEANVGQVLSGLRGQINQVREKARQTEEEKVRPFYRQLDQAGSFNAALEFSETCSGRYRQFEAFCQSWYGQLEAATKQDHEALYQKILAEHEQLRDRFRCQQCGAPISIEKIYFTTTYLKCPACSTQNTYEPSTLARSLNWIARDLAEARTAHLLAAYNNDASQRPELYRVYLRAMFDEWNKLVPDLTESNEKFYERQLADFNRSVK